MMKRILRPAAVLAAAAALATGAYAAELVPVGETVGIEVRTEGMLVAGLTGVETGSGEVCPAADSGIQPGDVIVRLGSHEISTSEDFSGAAAELDGSDVSVTLERGGQADTVHRLSRARLLRRVAAGAAAARRRRRDWHRHIL